MFSTRTLQLTEHHLSAKTCRMGRFLFKLNADRLRTQNFILNSCQLNYLSIMENLKNKMSADSLISVAIIKNFNIIFILCIIYPTLFTGQMPNPF